MFQINLDLFINFHLAFNSVQTFEIPFHYERCSSLSLEKLSNHSETPYLNRQTLSVISEEMNLELCLPAIVRSKKKRDCPVFSLKYRFKSV